MEGKTKTRVLIADDFEPNRFMLHRQFLLHACAIDEAVDGDHALALWHQGRHALIVTDLRMPKLDGVGLTLRIRAEEAKGHRRSTIVGLSALNTPSERSMALASGMDLVLPKPLTAQALLDALDRARLVLA